jgi:peptidoglycan-associated lipoprotein
MRKVLIVLLVLALTLLIAGCAEKKVVKPEQPETSLQKPPVLPQETREKRGSLKPEERITEQQLAKIETKEEQPKYKEESGLFEDIHFDFDKYDIRADAKPELQKIASWLLKNTSVKLSVEGHCDDRGTSEYNLALGDRRAKAVRDNLVALGIASNRIETVSYGKEKPFCTEKTEECWAKNRRAHFVVLREAGK